MTTQQGLRHQSARDTAGTTDTYDGDLRALFEAVATVPAGSTFNEAFMLWLQSVTGSSADNINDLAALFASQQDDTHNWSSVGELGLPILFTWNPKIGEALPASATFARASVAFYRNDSGLWVEAASGELRFHNGTAGGGAKGFLRENAATKLALFPRDFTNAAWVKVNGTAAKDATGIDGVANAASTLTSTSANFTALQSFTLGSTAHTFSVFVARKTGTGTIEITIDGGTTWVDITSSISSDIKDNPYVVTQTLANPSIGLRIVTSGDEIEVDMGDLEATGFASTPLDHAGSTASRAVESLPAGVSAAGAHSGLFDVTLPDVIGNVGSTLPIDLLGYTTPSTTSELTVRGASGDSYRMAISGAGALNINAGTPYVSERHKFAFSASSGDRIIVDDEGNSNTDTDAIIGGGALYIGGRQNNQLIFRGIIHNYIIYDTAQTQVQLEALVA